MIYEKKDYEHNVYTHKNYNCYKSTTFL